MYYNLYISNLIKAGCFCYCRVCVLLAPLLPDLVVLSVMLYHSVFVLGGGGGFTLVDSGVPLVQGFSGLLPFSLGFLYRISSVPSLLFG